MQEKKLKVLFISAWYPNKYKPLLGIFIKRHASANTIDGNISAIYVCAGENSSIEESVEDGIYTIRGYFKRPKYKIPPFSQLVRLIRYLLCWKKVLVLYKKKVGKPDIINSNIVYPVSIIAYLIKFIWHVPYVITEHWTGYFPEDDKYKGFVMKTISRIAVANAGAVITDSSKLGRTMTSLGLKSKYFTIPNVVDPEVFTLKTANTHQPSVINFIHVSSLDNDQKNVTGMIRTFKKFHVTHPLSKLTIIWNEEEKEFLDKIKLSEPFSEEIGIILQGRTVGVKLAAAIQKADAFILFSNYENLPCVMLESFFCGIPVIGTKVGDVPEYINEKNGILIDFKDENQLLNAMESIFKNISSYSPSEIRNMVLEKVSPAAVSKQFTDIYKMVLK